MKLYATTTSERASKGQGGKELNISVSDSTGACIMEIFIDTNLKGTAIVRDFWIGDINDDEIKNYYLKGNKQKDECKCGHIISDNTSTCIHCGKYFNRA